MNPTGSQRGLRRLWWLLFGVLMMDAPWGVDQAAGSEPSQLIKLPQAVMAPDFSLPDLDGGMRTLSSYQGLPVVVGFWATWCRPCREETPSFQRSLLPNRSTFPILMNEDPRALAKWEVRGLPTAFILDPQGRIVYKVEGALEWDSPSVIEHLLKLRTTGNAR